MTPDKTEAELDRMLAATLYLMSCHARTHCPRLACMVESHLRLVGRHPGAPEHIRHTARKLAAAWEAIRRHDERAPQEAPAPPEGPRRLH